MLRTPDPRCVALSGELQPAGPDANRVESSLSCLRQGDGVRTGCRDARRLKRNVTAMYVLYVTSRRRC